MTDAEIKKIQLKLLEEVERRVIGEDIGYFVYIDHLINDKKRKAVNKFKSRQREVIATMKGEI